MDETLSPCFQKEKKKLKIFRKEMLKKQVAEPTVGGEMSWPNGLCTWKALSEAHRAGLWVPAGHGQPWDKGLTRRRAISWFC